MSLLVVGTVAYDSVSTKSGHRQNAPGGSAFYFSISYNRYESYKHNNTGAPDQETDAFNIGYTVGGMTIGFQEAQTDNSGWATGTNDTRTLSVKVAF